MSAKYQPKVETNLRTRVTGNRLGYAADQLTYQLQASDIEDAYSPAVVAELQAMTERLYQLADETLTYQASKKASPKPKAEKKATPKKAEPLPTKGLTVKELRALYQQHTGTPAPTKWNKKALVEAVTEIAA